LTGIARRENVIDFGLMEYCIREELNKTATRRMVVLNPVKLIIDNFEEGKVEMLHGENNPEVEGGGGSREIPFSRELWIEREDFMENPPKKFFRLGPGLMVRLKHAYIIKCESFVTDANGEVTEIHATYVPESRSGNDTSGLHVKGTMHFVSAAHAVPVQVNLYDRLFRVENPASEDGDFKSYLNPDSLKVISTAYAESDLKTATLGDKFQFIRLGYFCVDQDSTSDKIIFNRTVTLKDSWAKESKAQ
jgi:glutaminyl-tRNA synthetase